MPHKGVRRWETLGRAALYSGRVRLVEHTVVLGDGTRAGYEVDESIWFAVATLVIGGEDVILARQYRYPLDRWIYDLPGGAGTESETPEIAARPKLEDELGLTPNDLTPLHTFYVKSGPCNVARSPLRLPLWNGRGNQGHFRPRGAGSSRTHARMPLRELDDAIASGEIVDPSLIVARACAAVRGLLPPLASSTTVAH